MLHLTRAHRHLQILALTALTTMAGFGCSSKPKTHDSAAQTPAASAPGASATKESAKDSKSDAKAKTETSSTTTASKLECANKADKRILELRNKDHGCELAYTKNGQEAIVSTSHYGTAHCEGTLTKIKGKLESAGYTCQ